VKSLSLQAKLYILAALASGAGLLAWSLLRLSLAEPWLLLAACGLASLTQILKVEGSTNRSSYNIGWMVFGFVFAMHGTPAALVVILVAHLVEWLWHKYPWYVQTFNIATYVFAVQAAGLVYSWSAASQGSLSLVTAFGLVAAMVVFTLVNHLMVGLVIWLARGENLVKSGVFGRLTLMIDFSLLCLGVAAALIWMLNPFAVVLTVIPLYLIYSTLRVPALERQTDTDPKTGLFNMRFFNRALEKELARALRDGHPVTIVVADLDLLRNINNTYGHLAGDAVLTGIAQILQKSVRAYDVVARFGGEEFAILMPEVTPEQAITRVEAIRLAVAAAEFQVATSVTPIRATMSFGIAGLARPDQAATEIVHNADLALYHSKLSGRNRASIYSNAGVKDLFSAVTPAAPEAAPPPPPSEPPAAKETPAPALPAQAEPRPAPKVRTRPWWLIKAYIGALALCAVTLLGFALPGYAPPDWVGLGAFALMLLLTEWLSIDIYLKDTSVSTAEVPYIAGLLLFGPLGAVVFSLVLAGTAMIKHRSPASRFIFNASNHLISGLLCLSLVRLVGRAFDVQSLPLLFGLAVASVGLAYLSSTMLVALAIDLDTGQPAWAVWSERFRWLAPLYLAMGVVSFALIFSYRGLGLVGALTIILPLGVLRLSQKQYIDRTTTMVSDLRKTNEVLVAQTKEVTTLNEELLLTLANAVDLRDPYVMGHSQHVARYAVLIAQELGLPPEQVEVVRKAGLLHDIGKLGIPERILFKPGPLTAAEYNQIQQHSLLGAQILSSSHALHRYIPVILHHHERFDGAGYPNRLKGHKIPLEARIVGVADAIEAMASDRPYRPGREAAAILADLLANSGTQFDPMIVEAFSAVIRKQGQGVIVNSALDVAVRVGSPQPTVNEALEVAVPVPSAIRLTPMATARP